VTSVPRLGLLTRRSAHLACSAKPWAWLSPNPVLRPLGLVVKKGSQTRPSTSVGIPVPVSRRRMA
jgi:hypothetical protein